jgi:hypothetical protein
MAEGGKTLMNVPSGTRSDTDDADGVAGQADWDSQALEDHAQKSEDTGSGKAVRLLDAVAALNGTGEMDF